MYNIYIVERTTYSVILDIDVENEQQLVEYLNLILTEKEYTFFVKHQNTAVFQSVHNKVEITYHGNN